MHRALALRLTGPALVGAAAGLFSIREASAIVPAPSATAPGCRVSFASGSDWTVYAADSTAPGTIAGAPLGHAQPVCLGSSSPGCPPGALIYGHPAPDAWIEETAPLGAAVWIWAPGVTPDAPGDLAQYVFVRRLELPKVGSGWMQLAADDFAEVRVNGTRVGAIGSVEEIASAAAAHASLATFDLGPYLVVGKNTISVTAQNGPSSYAGCANGCRYRENPAGVLFGGAIDVCGNPKSLGRPPDRPNSSAARVPACKSAAGGFARERGTGPGRWFFGWSVALDAPFVPFAARARQLAGLADGDGLAYRTPPSATHPVAFMNPTNAVRYPGGTMSLQPGQLALHPGPAGEYAIARWQATEPGRITITAEFFGLSSHPPYAPTTTDVHVRRGGVAVSGGFVNLGGAGNAFKYASTLDVAAGETVDFAVGFGNGTYDHDSTALDATVCAH